jgi:PAS domain S-box-containing protein
MSFSVTSADPLAGLLAFETLLSDLSSRFINLPPAEVDHEIEDALRRMCEHLGIDLALLWQWSVAAPEVIVPTHVYSTREDLRPSEPMRAEDYPWAAEQVRAGRWFALSSLEDYPPEAAVDRETCRRFGIKSGVCLPLVVGAEPPLGALGLNALTVARDWPNALVKRLQLVAQVFANALARRRHELSLRESEERLALAADSAEAGLWTLDYGTGVFWATERARANFGYSPDEVVTMDRFEASVHADDWDRVREAVRRSERAGEPVDLEYRIVLPGEGGERWIHSRGRPHLGPDGAPDRLMGVSIDVTERKRAEEVLRVSQARLEAASDLAGLAFYEVDFADRTVFVDERFRDIGGYPQGELPGLGSVEFWLAHVHPEDRQRFQDLREQLHGGKVDRASLEYRLLHPVKGQRWIHQEARVTSRDATGRTIKTFGVIRDITERRQREEQLRQSYAEIERLKDRLQAESDYLKAEIRTVHPNGEVTGQSPAIRKVLHLVEQVAPTDSSVLVRGETGSGKELVAQAIHRLSPRHDRLLVKVNCAALPSGLIESELFGREKGAFTGALTRQVGRFEVADGSTLFLDEIGELSLEVQAKLLRVLETGEFERLGSPKTIKVDVRLIAATNRDLVEEIKKRRFREDLYYRLNVFPIRVPPLRERPEDIPVLVWTFLEELSSRMGKKITQVPRRTMEALQRHSWPGNVRELRNVIEHGAILTTGDTLRVPLLDDAAPAGAPAPTLADSERELILRALESKGWHVKGKAGAAAALGLNPSTLYSRMKKLGIRPRT